MFGCNGQGITISWYSAGMRGSGLSQDVGMGGSGRFDRLSDRVASVAEPADAPGLPMRWEDARLLPVAGKDRGIGVDAAVTQERPATADIFSAVKVDVNYLGSLLVGAELSEDLPLRTGRE